MKRRKFAAVLAGMAVGSMLVLSACGGKDCESESGNDTTEPVTEAPTTSRKEANKETVGLLLSYDMTLGEDGKTIKDQSGQGNDGVISGTNFSVEDGSLFLDDGAFVTLPTGMFDGEDTLTVSVWLKNYTGAGNYSALFFGTTESMPVSYWLLNPCNPSGRLKSVFTDSVDYSAPYNTEVGASASAGGEGAAASATGITWSHYVTVIEPGRMTVYYNGSLVDTYELSRTVSDFGDNLAAYIGKSSYPDKTYTGYVRNLQIYDTAWSEADAVSAYGQQQPEEAVQTAEYKDALIENRADPYIIKSDDGYYYFTASYPMNGGGDADGYDRVILRRAATIDGLADAEEITIWDESASTDSHRYIWAPELHKIGGKWYILYAGSGSSGNVWDINCRVLQCTGEDPYTDEWVELGKVQALKDDTFSFTGFSLDMTYFECGGKHYLIWAQKPSSSNLYMAAIDPAEPWKLTSKPITLSSPEYYWEKARETVDEAPAVLQHDGKVFVCFSASGTGPEYCVGMLSADADADLMELSSWTKKDEPLLTSEDLTGEYGPGHNSFTVDEEGNAVFVYHSRGQECFDGACGYAGEDPLYDPCRSARVRTVEWAEDGTPILNGR